ncbi:hypothetical protein VTO42DRAFT_6658 [Malbranchea cinnamomea]
MLHFSFSEELTPRYPSRSRASMADPPRHETVFCHACGARWARSAHGLVCPSCNSDFAEILDNESDPEDVPSPRRGRSPSGFPGILPGLFSPFDQEEHTYFDDGTVTHNEFRSRDGRFSYTSTTYRSPRRPRRRRDSPRPPPLALDNDNFLNSVLQDFDSIIRGHNHNGLSEQTRRGRAAGSRPESPFFTPPFGTPFPGGPQRRTNEQQPSTHRNPPSLFDVIFQNFTDMATHQQNRGGADDPLADTPFTTILTQILGDMAHGGDAVWSQEEYDRILTQLMNQSAGRGPPPASPSAIRSLPKKVVDRSMLGDDGKAECSICMDNVNVGTEVTMLPCNHWFHGECITAWLNEHNTCPHCRRGIGTPPPGLSGMPRSEPSPTNSGPPGSASNPVVVNDTVPSGSQGDRSQNARHHGSGHSQSGNLSRTARMRNRWGGGTSS